MICGLVVLNSSYVGSRDLWWPNDPKATVGYNVYRAIDYPANWQLLNLAPIPGQFYRDISTLASTTYTVQDSDWIEKGTFGRWSFQIPDVPYSGIVETRPQVATSPEDVSVILATDLNFLNGSLTTVSGTDVLSGTISLQVGVSTPVVFTTTSNSSIVLLAAAITAAAIGVTATLVAYGGPYTLSLAPTVPTDTLTVISSLVATSTVRPAMVSGIDKAIWINVDKTLPIGGAVSNFPISALASVTTFKVTYNQLTNFVDIYTNMVRTYYTVVPVGASGDLHAPGAAGSEIVNTQTIERLNYMLKEQIRRNAWLFERVGEPAFIMFRMSRGTACGCVGDGVGEPRHGCPVCYETGWVGGYYGPFDIVYIPPDTATNTTIEEGGRKVERISKSYLGPTPIIQNGDLIIRRNGERLIVFDMNYTQPQGAIAQQEFNVKLLNPKDTRYLIPVIAGNPYPPTLYNPLQANVNDGVPGVDPEPIFEKTNQPDAQWENPNPEVGRTTVWGAIMS